jgi:hypothetical protein
VPTSVLSQEVEWKQQEQHGSNRQTVARHISSLLYRV